MSNVLELPDILKLIPHRAPFVYVDRVLDFAVGERITAIKNVTFNEPFFAGHFPGLPTMPGVLMLEAMAQASGILAVLTSGVRPESGAILYFAGIDHARFKRPVVPGDQLTLTATMLKQKRELWKFHARADVGSALACEADMMCVLKEGGARA